MRQKAKGARPKRNAERRAARRVVAPGFPIDARQFTYDEVREYFSGDTITCLLCGKSYKRISAGHLHRIHSMSEDEYRLRYGLPWRRGLTSDTSHQAYQEATLKRMDDGFAPPCNDENRKLAHAAPQRKHQRFHGELALRNLGSWAKKPRQIIDAAEPLT